jgi:phage protein U
MGYEIPKSAIGSLGTLPFVCSDKKVLTFSTIQRDNSVRWAKHEVVGRKPMLEYVGEDLSSVSLTIRFDISLGIKPQDGLDRLKRMLENKLYKTLIIGGEYIGRFVIESISEERKFHTGNGVCQVATANIKLLEWAGI